MIKRNNSLCGVLRNKRCVTTTSDSTSSTTPNNNPLTPVQDPWANQPTDDENGWPEADHAEAEHTHQAKANWDNAPNHNDRHGRRLYSHPYAREKALAETPFCKTIDRYLRISEREPLFEKLQKDIFTFNPAAAGNIIKYCQIAMSKWRTHREIKKLNTRLEELRYQEVHCRRFLNCAGIPNHIKYRVPDDIEMFMTEAESMADFLGPWDSVKDYRLVEVYRGLNVRFVVLQRF